MSLRGTDVDGREERIVALVTGFVVGLGFGLAAGTALAGTGSGLLAVVLTVAVSTVLAAWCWPMPFLALGRVVFRAWLGWTDDDR